ncbi:MAG: hypothetical protein JNK38_28205 [Acidobacteria bacterium]|nr:hypothetical protein [Acidobacteriota bacterium]
MTKNPLKISVFLFFCALFVAFGLKGARVHANSSGPPIGRTSAPGELTCATVQCHIGSPINSGGGTLTVTGMPANYTLNQEYTITITLTLAGRQRFGFQATVIDDQGREAGTLTITDPARTQVFPGTIGGNLRRYINHTFVGTSGSGQASWSFRWKAPATDVGRIRIFATGNAANDNGSADGGDLIYTTNVSSQPPVAIPAVATVSAASFAQNVSLAQDMIVAGFGSGLSVNVAVGMTNPLPTQLDGTEIEVRDATSTTRKAGLFFVAPSQINYVIPAGTVNGVATISVKRSGTTVAQSNVTIESVSPGIFTANAGGTGVPAANALRIVGNNQTFEAIYTNNGGQITPIPIDLTNGDVYLILYCTGVKGAPQNGVTATIGGTPTPILGFAATSEFVGLDQVNVGPIPKSLTGRGPANVVLTVGGKPANTVTINIK